MTYRIGQTVPPPEPAAASFAEHCPSAWYCVTPRATAVAHTQGRDFFRSHNMHAFYPSEEKVWGRDKNGRKRTAEVPMVSGYLFAQCLRRPLWHVIKREKWCAGVFRIGDTVIEFPYAVIRHLQGLTVDAERLARARADLERQMIEASRPVAGGQARFVAGPFCGEVVTVEWVQDKLATFELMGKRITADTASLRKVE